MLRFGISLILIPLMSIAGAGESFIVDEGVAQLFVDDALIGSSQGLVRTLHQPVKDFNGDRPIIAIDKLLEKYPATLEANGTIIYDPKIEKYVMFALAFAPSLKSDEPDGWRRTQLFRFISDDGITWEGGENGNPEPVFPKSHRDLYDPDSGTYANNIDLCSFYYDKTNENFPYQGWIWFANWGGDREGIYYVYSADGKTWERGPQIVAAKNRHLHSQAGRKLFGPADVTIFYPDPLTGRFLVTLKFVQDNRDEVTNNLFRSRAYIFHDQLDKPLDIKNLSEVALIPAGEKFNGDEPYDEYYGSTAWRYGSQWLGLLKVWHGKGDYSYSSAGCAYFKLVTSRNGLDWKKVPFANTAGKPEVFIANGKEGGNRGQNDGGYMTDFSQGPLKIGNELIFYYGSSSFGKNHPGPVRVTGGGIFRARLRIDGFVSVDGGVFTTPFLRANGNDLFVNSNGPVIVEVLDELENSIGSAALSADNLRHKICFEDKPLRALVGENATSGLTESFKLRFQVDSGGSLFSFRID